jgi:predicted HD phosphohydrolase
MDPNGNDRMHPTGGRGAASGTVPDDFVLAPIDTVDALVAVLELGAGRPEQGPPLTGQDDPPNRRGDGRVEGPDGRAERVDQLAHALQCAHELRLVAPDDVELQVAGLVHDIGRLLAPGDDTGHGRSGATAVGALLGDRVARLVELHVPAKRYLVSTDRSYRARLSPVSTLTLDRQGGDMTADEMAAFAGDPFTDAAVVLRRADEAAKRPGRDVPPLDTWRSALDRTARQASR